MSTQSFNPINSQTSYLPPELDFPENPKIFRDILSQRERLTATILNVKENAQYEKRELLTGQQRFSTQSAGAIKTSYVYRITCDLVELNNNTAIPAGVTNVSLNNTTQPPLIQFANAIEGTHGSGSATDGTNIYFINGADVDVKITSMTTTIQTITITNNTGVALIKATWVFEYIKS